MAGQGSEQNIFQSMRPLLWPGQFEPVDGANSVIADPNAAVDPSILCSKCECIRLWLVANPRLGAWPGKRNLLNVLRHHDTGAELEQSGILGCHLCTLLWHSIFRADYIKRIQSTSRHNDIEGIRQERQTFLEQVRTARKVTVLISTSDALTDAGLPAEFELQAQLEFRDTAPIGFYVQCIELAAWPKNSSYSRAASCSISTAANAVWRLASEWFNDCVTSHKKCKQSRTGHTFVPTRLLDVGSATEATNPHLVLTSEENINAQYLALSYCWGGTSAFILTTTTLESLRSGIPIQEFPRTIRDAILVSRKLGFRYIWIDSVCIVQDSVDDWEHQAASMMDVYNNACLTLAALGAANSDAGFFGQRDPLMYTPCRMFRNRDGHDIVARLPLFDPFETVFHKSPLHQRAWVMQERLLSPRTLNFGTVLVWECRERLVDEYGLNSHQGRNLKGQFLSWQLVIASSTLMAQSPLNGFLRFWNMILSSYTASRLTVATDRLVAISGIIRTIQNRTGWRNVAGLWPQFMPYQLLWRKSAPGNPIFDTMPSWSWAATDGPVRSELDGNGLMIASIFPAYDNSKEETLKHLARVEAEVSTRSDRERHVAGGSIHLMGDLVSIEGMPTTGNGEMAFGPAAWPATRSTEFVADVFPLKPGPYSTCLCWRKRKSQNQNPRCGHTGWRWCPR